MAAATISGQYDVTFPGFLVRKIVVSSMTADQLEDVAHGGPSGCKASFVLPIVTTRATSGDPVSVSWERAGDSTANNTIRVRASVPVGGDITGAVVDLYIFFVAQASGGITV